MATVASLNVRVSASTTEFDKGLASMEKSLARTGAQMQSIGSKLSTGVTLPLVAAASIATKFASDFEASTTKLVTLSGISAASMGKMRQAVLALAPSVGIGPQALADALLVVTSTGFEGAAAMDILTIAAKSSAIGMGDAKDIARALTAAISAYGAENMTAAQAGDILHATVVAGGADADQLAGEIGRVVGVASQLGVSFQEVGAFIATYTRLGLSAAEATTGLSGVLNMILNPSTEARNALDGLGMTAGTLRQQVAEQGLGAALTGLIGRLHGNADATGALFGNVRALAGVMGTAGTQAEGYRSNLDKITHSTGSVNAAFAETKKTTAFQWEALKAQAQVLAITLGNELLPRLMALKPAFESVLTGILGLVTWFGALPQPVQTGVIAFLAFAAALGPLIYLVGNVTTSVSALLGAYRLMGGVSGAATSLTSSMGAGFTTLSGIIASTTTALIAFYAGWQLGKQIDNTKVGGLAPSEWVSTLWNYKMGMNGISWEDAKLGAKGSKARAENPGGPSNPVDDLIKATEGAQNTMNAARVKRPDLFGTTGTGSHTSPKGKSDAQRQAEADAKNLQNITGASAIAAASAWMKQLTKAGGVTKLTEKATEDLNRTLGEAFQAYALIGETAPKAMVDTWVATMQTVKVTNGITPGQFGEALKLPTVPEIAIPNLPKVTDGLGDNVFGRLKGEGSLFGESITLPNGIAEQTVSPFREAFDQLGKDLPGLVFGALQHGGSVVGALASGIGAQFSGQFQKALKDAGGDLSKVSGANKALGYAGAAITGGMNVWAATGSEPSKAKAMGKGAIAGMEAGAAFGPWGAAIGLGVGALIGLFHSIFGTAGRDKVKDFATAMGGFDDLHKQLDKLGPEGEKLWIGLTQGVGRNNPAEAEAAIKKITDALENRLKGVAMIMDGVNARGKVFGDTLAASAAKQSSSLADTMKAAGVSPDSDAGKAMTAQSNEQFKVGGQDEFNRVGAMALGAFGAGVQTGDGGIMATLQQMKPTLDLLNQAQTLYNFTASETTQRLLDINAAVQANLPAFQALEADGQILNGMLKANWADMGLFAATSSDVAAQIASITAGGMPMSQALALNQPVLQSLWEAQQKFGFLTDDATKALLDQAVTQGIVGPQMKSVNDKMLDVLLAIGKVLGADIPAALAGLPGAATTAASGMSEAFGKVKLPDLRPNIDTTGLSGDSLTTATVFNQNNTEMNAQANGGRAVAPGPDIPALAAGGVVNRKTLAWIGEAGPEAVIPISDLASILGSKNISPLQGMMGAITGGLGGFISGSSKGGASIEDAIAGLPPLTAEAAVQMREALAAMAQDTGLSIKTGVVQALLDLPIVAQDVADQMQVIFGSTKDPLGGLSQEMADQFAATKAASMADMITISGSSRSPATYTGPVTDPFANDTAYAGKWKDRAQSLTVPQLARGGIVRARPGGTLVNVGEGGQDEMITPLTGGRAGGDVHVHFHGDVLGEEEWIQTRVVDGVLEGIRLNRNSAYTRAHAALGTA